MVKKGVRKAIFAGTFYPLSSAELRSSVSGYIESSPPHDVTGRFRGLIVPHAGYVYSGSIAGAGYKAVRDAFLVKGVDLVKVFLLGPSHRFPVNEIAVADFRTWETPLGDVPESDTIEMFPAEYINNEAHLAEHSLEVQLPFLQVALEGRLFEMVPMLVGADGVELALNLLQKHVDEKSLVVVSTDLSHYLPYEKAKANDTATIGLISAGEPLLSNDACGSSAIEVISNLAKKNGWKPQLLKYGNSGDTAGDKDAVVGYASIAFTSQ